MANANDPNFFSGHSPVVFTGEVNSGDTSAKDLFVLPANCVIIGGAIVGYFSAASNATSANISVGVSPRSGGAGNEYLNKWSLVGSQGSNYQGNIPWTRFGSQASNTWTVGSSNAFSAGSNSFIVSGNVGNSPGAGSGPWQVVFYVLDTP